ncbi:MAG TPA: N-(5'-phosphoribosyl)anthranilate isomerase, partial [Rhodanobacter sp.]
MTRIKCCGMTRVEDALLAARLGADAIGLVFTARSRRRVAVAQAQAIVRALPPFVSTVALFMDDTTALVEDVIAAVAPDLLQFHGGEPDEWCARFGRRYLKAIAMGEGAAALARLRDHPGAAALLLDGHGLGEAGGGGRA